MRNVADGAIAACVVALTVWVIGRGRIDARPPAQRGSADPQYVADWARYAEAGHQIGPSTAPVKIVEMMDFKCPACKAFAATVDSALAEWPEDVAVYVVHTPRPAEPLALVAAMAAECAAAQGRFLAMYRELYAAPDSFGITPWANFAERAGVPDAAAFEACRRMAPDSFPRIRQGVEAAIDLGVYETPTVLLNGWRWVRRPRLGDIRAVVERARSGADNRGDPRA